MKNFATFRCYICTANEDGSIPLNAKTVCEFFGVDKALLSELIAQANLGKELAEALNTEPPEYVNAIRKYKDAVGSKS
jgi:hypothetical protein